MKICLDAGHYGKYNHSPVNAEYWESDFTWKFHLLLKSELEKRGFSVITTRSSQEKDLKLETRGSMSDACDLFLSIHSNACGTESVDYPLACCTVNGTADVLGHELAETVGNIMKTSGKSRIIKKKQDDGRDWYGVLRGAASVGTPGILLEHSFHTNRKATDWLLNDDNLQRMAEAEAETIAAHFGAFSTDSTDKKPETACAPEKFSTNSTARIIWDTLREAGLSAAGAAGLMGNLKAESNLDPENLQNSCESKLGYHDSGYTTAVDFGAYKDFADDGAGYGLAQWTYHTRKSALLAFAESQEKSVGDLHLQLEFLLKELREDYPALLQQLCTSENVQAASDAVLTQFERPADMSESVKQKRAEFAAEFLEQFGKSPADAVTDTLQGTLTLNGKTYAVTLTEVRV